jgi:DNA polymerase (family 10)
MKNQEIAEIFYEMADILEMQGVEWKPRAYRRAAKSIESLSEAVEDIYERGGIKELQEIPGVGERIAKKIVEYIEKGKIKEHQKLRKSIPKHINRLMDIPGMGPKKAKKIYDKLKISTMAQLEKAIKQHRIAKLPGMGEKSEQDLLRGIQIYKGGKQRKLLGEVLPVADELKVYLEKSAFIKKVDIAGSLRRMKETIGDIDILTISSKPEKAMDYFTKFPDIRDVLAKGKTKATVILKSGIQADVRVIEPSSYGAALQYFTGSKEHSVALRSIAKKKGLKISEYGVFRTKLNKLVAGKTEQEVYNAVGLSFIEPELRENRGEIEAAMSGKLPKLVRFSDIKGDLHVHSKYSDGNNTIKEIAEAARKFGYQYICISDHSQTRKIAGGVSESDFAKKLEEVKKINRQVKGIKVLMGTEVDILADGSLDYPDELLRKTDIVTAAVHSGFKFSKSRMTNRVLKALENKYVDVLAHPTGRIINYRPGYEVDLRQLMKVCAEKKIAMEINASPDRLDLNDLNIREAIEKGVKLAIGTDSHSTDQLRFMKLGVATARRGWAMKKDILNTLSFNQLSKFFGR